MPVRGLRNSAAPQDDAAVDTNADKDLAAMHKLQAIETFTDISQRPERALAPRWLWDLNKVFRARPRRPPRSAAGGKSGRLGSSVIGTIRFPFASPPFHDR